ncbi:hypothetical protein QJS66_03615 [Kocuria rhizophila]|nr:hypothetical protein QJS66_03615 [Kocuria rhizophila]
MTGGTTPRVALWTEETAAAVPARRWSRRRASRRLHNLPGETCA